MLVDHHGCEFALCLLTDAFNLASTESRLCLKYLPGSIRRGYRRQMLVQVVPRRRACNRCASGLYRSQVAVHDAYRVEVDANASWSLNLIEEPCTGIPEPPRGGQGCPPLKGVAPEGCRVMSWACTGNGVNARKRAHVLCKADPSGGAASAAETCLNSASDRRPARVPPLQDVSKFRPRGSAREPARGK